LGLGVVQWQSVGVDGQAQRAVPVTSRPVVHYDDALLSKPTHNVRMEVDEKVPMRDGTQLSVDIYRPDTEGRFPAILVRTPYSNGTDAGIEQGKWFAARGYVFITGDVRGKYDSKGDFYPFRNEADDGYDTDEWIGRQPWFNGKLGTMGGSYVGFTQLSQAIRGSKYLVAMAPQVTTSDIYNNWIYNDGALSLAFASSWGSVSIDGQIAQATASAHDFNQVYRHLPLIDAHKVAARPTGATGSRIRSAPARTGTTSAMRTRWRRSRCRCSRSMAGTTSSFAARSTTTRRSAGPGQPTSLAPASA
jgi:putative CocE/NonD family hydrolase